MGGVVFGEHGMTRLTVRGRLRPGPAGPCAGPPRGCPFIGGSPRGSTGAARSTGPPRTVGRRAGSLSAPRAPRAAAPRIGRRGGPLRGSRAATVSGSRAGPPRHNGATHAAETHGSACRAIDGAGIAALAGITRPRAHGRAGGGGTARALAPVVVWCRRAAPGTGGGAATRIAAACGPGRSTGRRCAGQRGTGQRCTARARASGPGGQACPTTRPAARRFARRRSGMI
jgi:hypothetical protein